MKAKTNEKMEAIHLRQTGMSVKKIARALSVSPSSVSSWVKDVVLSEEQKSILEFSNRAGASARSDKCLDRRRAWQEQGKEMARSLGEKFRMGCVLYWCEGAKGRTTVDFCNSDAKMMSYFVWFLKEFFALGDRDITLTIRCYTNNGIGFDDIRLFWLKELGLPESCMRKCLVNYKPSSSYGTKKGKLLYGVAHLKVSSVEVVQKLFGAIKHIVGFDKGEWL